MFLIKPQNHSSNNNICRFLSVFASVSSSTDENDDFVHSPSSPSNSCIRTMEDVWQEIELSSLPDRPRPGGPMASASFHTSGPPAVSLQDFLARPFHRDINNDNHLSHHLSTFPRLPPVTVLSLVSRSDSMSSFPSGPVSDKIRANAPQFHARGSPCNPFKNRPAPPMESGDDDFEQKRLRLMKNRESAARSRARKQAYTNELETEVIHLQEENAKLRRQYHELKLAGPALIPEKHSHRRTLTAPF